MEGMTDSISKMIMTRIMMRTKTTITISLLPATRNTRKKMTTTTTKTTMTKMRMRIIASLIPAMTKRKTKTRKNMAATTAGRTIGTMTRGTIRATVTADRDRDRDRAGAPAKAGAVVAGNTAEVAENMAVAAENPIAAAVHPAVAAENQIAAAALPVAAEASPPWIATRSDASPVKEAALTTSNAAATDTTKVVAVEAGLPRARPAGAALRKALPAEVQARRGEARKAHPAEAVLLPIAVPAAAVVDPPPGEAIPGNNATQAVSSPAAADAQVMATAVPVAAARAAAAAIPAAAAAPAAAKRPNDAFHHYKQIGLATALFVCFKTI